MAKSRRGSENRARQHQVTVRLDTAEKELLERIATGRSITIPELLRSSGLQALEPGEAVVPFAGDDVGMSVRPAPSGPWSETRGC